MCYLTKKLIYLPNNIKLYKINNTLKCIGPLGFSYIKIFKFFDLIVSKNILFINIINPNLKKISKRSIISNFGLLYINILKQIIGLSQGYYLGLQCIGVGFKITINFIEQKLILKLGYSHLITIKIPNNIYCCLKNKILYIYGSNYQKITQFASIIRKIKEPDIYKGKGFKYLNEVLILKEGKKTKY